MCSGSTLEPNMYMRSHHSMQSKQHVAARSALSAHWQKLSHNNSMGCATILSPQPMVYDGWQGELQLAPSIIPALINQLQSLTRHHKITRQGHYAQMRAHVWHWYSTSFWYIHCGRGLSALPARQ